MGWTLAEELLLLAYNREGRPMAGEASLSAGLAGAVVMDLVLSGGLHLSGGRLVATGKPEPLALMVHGLAPKEAVRKTASGLRDAMLYNLAAQGAFVATRGRTLGMFPTTLWSPVGQAPVMARLRASIVDRRAPDTRTAALVSFLQTLDLLPKLFPNEQRRAIRDRGSEISTGSWATAAVREAIQTANTRTAAALFGKWLSSRL